ncbi:pseudaminic acid cytidylyltransferase [Psychrobacter celer]|uniref:pseudaminic acid cytidylyltransferase n=1 Tax=Psychrobacter celer TaxID=306572 RepID=UPI002FE442F0
MTSVALIPARGGSKRIPRKNIKNFCGKPIIAYSIETALKSGCFDKVIVSTDDDEIAAVAKEYGAEVPFLRPEDISNDFATTKDVINHFLDYLKKNDYNYDYLCTIYATAPLLKETYLIEGYNKLKNSDVVNVFSCTTMPFPIQRTFKLNHNDRCEMFWPENFNSRSQDLEEAYQDAGQFYWRNLNIDSTKNMFGSDSAGVVIPRHFVQDIDTLEDWERAEYMYQLINK